MFYQQGLVARSPAAHVSADTTCTTTMQREHAASCTSQRPKQEQVRNLAVFFSIFHWSTSGRALGALQHTADTHICFSQTLSAVICWKVLAARWQPGAELPISPSGVLGAVSLVPPAAQWCPRRNGSSQHSGQSWHAKPYRWVGPTELPAALLPLHKGSSWHWCLTFSVQYHGEVLTSAKTTRHLE